MKIDSIKSEKEFHRSFGLTINKKTEYLDQVQKTYFEIPKKSLNFLEALREKRKDANHVPKTKLSKNLNGFSMLIEESGGKQQKIFNKVNKDDMMRKKFEKEMRKQLEEEKIEKPKNSNSRIKIPNIVVYEDSAEQMINEWEMFINDVMDEVKEELKMDRIRYPRNRTFRKDRNTNKPLDYALIFFDTDEIAAKFIEIIEGLEFYDNIIRPTILPPRY